MRERVRLVAGSGHGVRQFSRTRAALRKARVDDNGLGAGIEGELLDERELARRVGREAVDGDHARQPVLPHDLHVRREVVGALGERIEVLGRQHVERLAAVRLGCANRRHEHRGAGREATGATDDVAELLESEVAGKAGFRDDVVGRSSARCGRRGANSRRARCCRTARRAPVPAALQCLHDVRLDGFLHDHRHRAGHLEHLGGHRLALDRSTATTMRPRRRRRSARPLASAKTAITSDAAVMTNWFSRGTPWALPPSPTTE